MTTEAKSPVRWGILSTANIATKVARAIHLARNADLIAVASRTEERAAAWGQEHNVSTTYGTYDALLADDALDAIYIPLPALTPCRMDNQSSRTRQTRPL